MIKSIIALFIAGTLGVTGLAVAPKSVTKAATTTAKKATKAVTKAATSKASGALNGVKADSYYKEYNITPPKAAKTGGAISNETGRAKTKYVQGYYRKDGTYVQGYYRS